MENILLVENLWWAFGAFLWHTKFSIIYAMKNNYKYYHKYNHYPVFRDGTIEYYFNRLLINYPEDKLVNNNIIKYDPSLSHSKELQEWKPHNYKNVEDFYSDILKYIYVLNPTVKDKISKNRLLKSIIDEKRKYIAVHVRWCDKIDSKYAESVYIDLKQYLDKCVKIRNEHNINDIILCCDTSDAIDEIIKMNKDSSYNFNIIWNTEENRCRNNWLEHPGIRFLHGKIDADELEQEHYTAIINFELLLNSFAIVANYDSGFALCAAELRNNKLDVHIRDGITPKWRQTS